MQPIHRPEVDTQNEAILRMLEDRFGQNTWLQERDAWEKIEEFMEQRQAEPTTTDSGIDLDKLAQKLDAILQGYDVHNDALALIERLRTAEAERKRETELRQHADNTIYKLEEQVGREIRVRNNVIAELEAERDDLKESLRTTRLEQAAKAFQVDDLESKVERLTTEHEKDRQAWMSENTELLTQVERLTEELDYWKSEAALEKGG